MVIFENEINETKDGWISLSELVKHGNEWRKENKLPVFNLCCYMKYTSTRQIIELTGGVKGKSYKFIHPLLALNTVLAINPNYERTELNQLFNASSFIIDTFMILAIKKNINNNKKRLLSYSDIPFKNILK